MSELSDGLPVAFHDLPAEAFPFVIEFYREDNRHVIYRVHVTGPGSVQVPPLARMHGVPIGARVVPTVG